MLVKTAVEVFLEILQDSDMVELAPVVTENILNVSLARIPLASEYLVIYTEHDTHTLVGEHRGDHDDYIIDMIFSGGSLSAMLVQERKSYGV